MGTVHFPDAAGGSPVTATANRPFALFDLDGTVIRPASESQRAHVSAMAGAIESVIGPVEAFHYRAGALFYGDTDLAGYTDAGTIRAVLARAGVPGESVPALTAVIVAEMVGRMDGLTGAAASCDDVLPGCRELLESLRDSGFALGMSTGNARGVAAWKMRRARLSDLLCDGGFGDTATDREQVVAAAAARFGGTRGVLFGDTPRDVTAARSAGLPCIAVATGVASARALADAGADVVLPDLTGPEITTALVQDVLDRSAAAVAASTKRTHPW